MAPRLQAVELAHVVTKLKKVLKCVCAIQFTLEKQSERDWKFWCDVDEGEDCGDVKEGRSFEACLSGDIIII